MELVFRSGCFSSCSSFKLVLVVETGQVALVWGQDGNGESEGEGCGLESVSLALNPSKVTTALAESDLRKAPETLSHLLHKI